MANFKDLIGKTLTSVDVNTERGDEIIFNTSEGEQYRLFHVQECCEWVTIESIVGDINDLVGVPVLMAEEATSEGEPREERSATWTFYKLATIKGYVDIRWFGESNGYYSETVDFERVE